MRAYFTRKIVALVTLIIVLFIFIGVSSFLASEKPQEEIFEVKKAHWFMLYRQSEKEELYFGVPGDKSQSKLVRTFVVKTGRPQERPTPLPQLVGREYWLITDKFETFDNPETAPYFLTLNVPGVSEPPFGPVPYEECGGQQCDWILPGAFGLHGTAGIPERLSKEDPGSSGCIRHRDEDITYLYNLLDPKNEEIRYYIEDR